MAHGDTVHPRRDDQTPSEFERALDLDAEPEAPLPLVTRSARHQRRRLERSQRPAVALNVIPMIDVVFQLLVFFLFAGHLAGQEDVFRVDLPTGAVAPAIGRADAASEPSASDVDPGADPGTNADPFELDREPLRVLVTTTGAEPEDYRLEVVGLPESPRTFEELRNALQRQLVDPATGRGSFLPDHPVVLEPSPATTWEHSVGAFNAAVRAGCVNVVFRGLR